MKAFFFLLPFLTEVELGRVGRNWISSVKFSEGLNSLTNVKYLKVYFFIIHLIIVPIPAYFSENTYKARHFLIICSYQSELLNFWWEIYKIRRNSNIFPRVSKILVPPLPLRTPIRIYIIGTYISNTVFLENNFNN